MSKKIIYLLSLLMALSLVFASCKKNDGITGGNIDGNPPDEGGDTSMTDPGTGLMPDWESITKEGYINKITVFKPTTTDFYRNPVIVVLGDKNNKVAVFTEKRYLANGGDNDVGITGELVVDIAYTVSGNSGNSFKNENFVNPGNSPTTVKENAHGAPVVFKVANNKVIIVASAGAGIGRVNQTYEERKGTMPSRIDYIEGTFNEDSNDFTWTDWKTILKDELGAKVATINSGNQSIKFNQFATHTAKGVVSDAKDKIYVPVVMAFQGKVGDAYELMGTIMVTGTLSSGSVSKWEMGDSIAFTKANDRFSNYKESRFILTTSSDVTYLAVPNPSYATVVAEGSISVTSGTPQQPVQTALPANEGSPAFIDFGLDKWYGYRQYKINSTTFQMEKDTQDPIQNRGLYMHVKDLYKNVTLYLVDTTDSAKIKQLDGSTPKLINAQGKSSSIDMLGDGTIVIAAEEGAKSGVKDFYVSFTRYGQEALAKELGETVK